MNCIHPNDLIVGDLYETTFLLRNCNLLSEFKQYGPAAMALDDWDSVGRIIYLGVETKERIDSTLLPRITWFKFYSIDHKKTLCYWWSGKPDEPNSFTNTLMRLNNNE